MALFTPKAVKLYKRGDVDGLIGMLGGGLEDEQTAQASRALIALGPLAVPKLVGILDQHDFVVSTGQQYAARATLGFLAADALHMISITLEHERDSGRIANAAVLAAELAKFARVRVPDGIRIAVVRRTHMSWEEIEESAEADSRDFPS